MPNHHLIDFSGVCFNVTHYPVLQCMGLLCDETSWAAPTHAHEGLVEVIYVTSGEGCVTIAGKRYPLRPGVLAIYNPGVYHQESWASTKDSPRFYHCKFSELAVSKLPPNQLLPDTLCPTLDTGEYAPFFESCFGAMFAECSQRGVGYEQVCQNLLKSVVLVILRLINNQSNAFDEVDNDSLAMRVRNYISANYMRKITIRDIAAELHISYFHLSHAFKSELAVSPQSYLISYRMSEACRLLANTELSIHEICQRVGYNNQSHFNAQFKAFKQLSPSEYRRAAAARRVEGE